MLCKHAGKLSLIIASPEVCVRLSPGMLVLLELRKLGERFCAEQVAIVSAPMCGKDDLLWIHHLLELCYYFIPVGLEASDVYDAVAACLDILSISKIFESNFDVVKKLCAFKVMCLLGFYPPKNLISYIPVFHYLVAVSVDSQNYGKVISLNALLENISNNDIQCVNTWMLECMNTHHCSALFKTYDFLKGISQPQ